MSTLLENLYRQNGLDVGADERPFQPVARYYPRMDFMLYLNEDCSYRADRVDQFLTILLHPQEDRPVGVKLKGFRFLFQRLRNVVEGLEDQHFYPLVKVIEFALVGGVAESIIDDHVEKKHKVEERYRQAQTITRDVEFSLDELNQAAA